MAWSRCSISLLLCLATIGCAGPRHYQLELMPAPAVFADWEVDPMLAAAPPFPPDDFGMFYATDRKPAESPHESPFYLNAPGFVVRMGRARITTPGAPGDWREARRTALSTNRPRSFPLQVAYVEESGVLTSTYTFVTRPDPLPATPDDAGERLAELVDRRLAASGVKDVYVYVHGFRVVFDNPVLIAAELWHFLGFRGAFVAYAWPATPRGLAYGSDLETAITKARHLRLFLTFLAEKTQAERIHIVAYSAGSRLVVQALEQMALLNADASDEQIREDVRIGNVVIVASDISRERFGAAVADGLLRVSERVTVYVSSADRALRAAAFIFGRPRLGQMWSDDMLAQTATFVRRNPSLEFIDVTGAAGATTGTGHDFFRTSPWVSSDMLALLAYDIDPTRRGLVKHANLPVWTFPPDYVERLRKTLLEVSPRLAGG